MTRKEISEKVIEALRRYTTKKEFTIYSSFLNHELDITKDNLLTLFNKLKSELNFSLPELWINAGYEDKPICCINNVKELIDCIDNSLNPTQKKGCTFIDILLRYQEQKFPSCDKTFTISFTGDSESNVTFNCSCCGTPLSRCPLFRKMQNAGYNNNITIEINPRNKMCIGKQPLCDYLVTLETTPDEQKVITQYQKTHFSCTDRSTLDRRHITSR